MRSVHRISALISSLAVLAQGCGGLVSDGLSQAAVSDAQASGNGTGNASLPVPDARDGGSSGAGSGGGSARSTQEDACKSLCSRYPAEACAETLVYDECVGRCLTQLEQLSPSCELPGVELVQCMATYLDPLAKCTPAYGGCTGYGCPKGVLNGCSEFISRLASCSSSFLPWPLPSDCAVSGTADVSACDLTMTCGAATYRARCTYPSTQFEPYDVYADCMCLQNSAWVGPNGTNSDGNSACLYMLKNCGAPL